MSLLLKLEQQQKRFLKIHFEFAYFSLSDGRRLLSYNCYQMSDVICYVIPVIRPLMSNIRRLIRVI